jgi:hypothetical protein
VVAQEMGAVACDINSISKDLRSAIETNTQRLEKAGAEMMATFRGTRLTDLSHNAIEIIDRNLYERSCDVRWWATDSAVVGAAAKADRESCSFASSRLATILRSYTVYLDLWIADRQGRVIATGRPTKYPAALGRDVSREPWFTAAMRTRDGDDFAVSDIETNTELNGAAVATYSTAIRADGQANGRPIGALGIFFDWAPQAATIVEHVGLTKEEASACRVMLLDARHRVIASSDGAGLLTETYALSTAGRQRGFYEHDGVLTAFALTPGYETYEGLGWYGAIEWRTAGADSAAALRQRSAA